MHEEVWPTLDIRMFRADASGYPVELSLGDLQYPGGTMPLEVVSWAAAGPKAADGARLFALLFADPVLREAWAAIEARHPHRRLRLRIDDGAPELQAVPWELLQDPRSGSAARFVAADADTPFFRHVQSTSAPPPAIVGKPRVLLAVSGPSNVADYGLAPIDADAERRLLRDALGAGYEVESLAGPCTLTALVEALQRGGHHVLHLVAHGAFNGRSQRGAVFLEDPRGRVAVVDELKFAEAVQRIRNELRLAVLVCCESATGSSGAAQHGIAARLVAAGVPAVLAMQDRVAVPTARSFAGAFYRDLGEHGRVDLAANTARAAVMTAELPGAAIPVLLSRLGDGRLFTPSPSRGPIGPESAASDALVATLFTGVGFTGESWRAESGDYGIDQISPGNDRIRSARVPSGLRLRLYGDAQFTGRTEIVDGDTPELLLADDVSGVRVEPHVVSLYTSPRYAGEPSSFGLGEHAWRSTSPIASLRVPAGLRVRLRAGDSELVAALDTPEVEFAAPSAVIVERHCICLYEFPDFQGRCQWFGIGRYDLDALAIGNDASASIRVPAGLAVSLFEDAAFSGARVQLRADAPELDVGVSSLIVAPARRG